MRGNLRQVPLDDRIIVAIVCDACHFDASLSWKACGLLWYLLSHSDGWQFYRQDLINRHTDGTLSVKNGLKELRDAGYLRIVPKRTGTGALDGHDWFISALPMAEEEWEEVFGRKVGNQSDGEPESPKGRFSPGRETDPHRELHKEKLLTEGKEENENLFPEKELDAFVMEVGRFCETIASPWKLKRPIRYWCREIGREAAYAGLDFAFETRKAAEYWEGNGKKRPRSPDRALRNWFGNAIRFAREEQSAKVEKKEEEVGLPEWAREMAEEFQE